MVKFKNREISVLCREMGQLATGVTGVPVRVFFISPRSSDSGQLAFTDGKSRIWINFQHSYYDDLSKEQTMVMIHGLLAHEIMHLLMSDGKLLELALKSRTPGEQEIFAELNNILEDSSIEFFMPLFIGGHLLRDLDFLRAQTYKKSPRIDEGTAAKHPYYQFISAFIQFGDAGLIKGEFTFPEAKECFLDTISLWSEGVTEKHAHKRILLSEEIFERTRPLWEEIASTQDALLELVSLMGELGKMGKPYHGAGKGSTPLTVPKGSSEEESKREKRRRITIKRISKEEADKLKEEGSVSDELPPDGDITILVSEGDTSGNTGSASTALPDCDATASKDSKSSSDEEDGCDGAELADSGEIDSKESEALAGTGGAEKSESAGSDAPEEDESDCSGEGSAASEKDKADNLDYSGAKPDDSDDKDTDSAGEDSDTEPEAADKKEGRASGERGTSEAGEYDEDDADNSDKKEDPSPPETEELTEEEEDRIAETIEDELEVPLSRIEALLRSLGDLEQEMSREEEADEAADSAPLDLPLSNGGYQGACSGRKCANISVTVPPESIDRSQETYAQLLAQIQPETSMLAGQLQRLFRNVHEENVRRTSGKININRLCNGRMSSRVFDRRLAPSDRSDIAVFLLIDESGSMYGHKIVHARLTAIGLAEALTQKIPVYVMGFQADDDDYHADVLHHHYMRWRNTQEHRLRLLNIAANSNNFDGYSIRYASELLKKRPEAHKLLIVVSDGAPECITYNKYDGDEDTRQAIKEASQIATVIGVLVGSDNPNLHRMFYGRNFLHVTDARNLLSRIGGFLANLIKGW